MTDLDGLLHAVLENPADDTPRLIYADAMEESRAAVNHARAEFIRLQIAGEGEARQAELLPVWLGDWFGRVPTPLASGWWAVGDAGDPSALQFEVSRGFISGVANLGLPPAPWDEWTPWTLSECLGRTITDLLSNHPVERIVLDIGAGEEWWVEPPDGDGPWACLTVDRRVLCRNAPRRRFVADLTTALRDRSFALALAVWDAQRHDREAQRPGATARAMQRMQPPPRDR